MLCRPLPRQQNIASTYMYMSSAIMTCPVSRMHVHANANCICQCVRKRSPHAHRHVHTCQHPSSVTSVYIQGYMHLLCAHVHAQSQRACARACYMLLLSTFTKLCEHACKHPVHACQQNVSFQCERVFKYMHVKQHSSWT